ncbi:Protein RTC2 [Ceratocystis platani]|uniref:Protein RTC2 n=1 Tax=Ceratocystis fimbriata f. sp. platani TaxID=88771 RepID=A0A0F8DAH6_CERFI|nr:Protein RTC2 [Ceratocystis platani]
MMVVPPMQPLNLDVEAISGICGSISIACWVVVFTPQILQNFRRSSTDGLSIQFIIVWLVGDVFNIIGGLMQGILPTMIILAFYYTIADMVLLGQCFYYRGFTWKDEVSSKSISPPTERTRLLDPEEPETSPSFCAPANTLSAHHRERRSSDWTNLSPAVPLVHDQLPSETAPATAPSSTAQSVLLNTFAVLMVICAGFLGWFLSARTGALAPPHSPDGDLPPVQPVPDAPPQLDFWGQVFGYLCAALYILSRLPQLVLNYRRKSTDGLSMLFFLFACLGNVTYVLSVLAYEPKCTSTGPDGETGVCAPGEAWALYGQYMLVNASWLAGSSATLMLDFCVFVQYFIYDVATDEEEEAEQRLAADDNSYRPILDGESAIAS